MTKIWVGIVFLCGLASGQASLDRLGRTTPRSSFMGFLRSGQEGNFAKATRYLQFGPGVSEKDRVETARELLFVLDRGFVGNLDTLSSKPEGSGEDGVGVDQESIGAVVGSEQSSPVVMVRVNEGGQQVWLLSREMVDMAPQMFAEFGFPGVERMLPRMLIDNHVFSMPLWVLLGILIALPIAMGLAWLLVFIVARLLPVRWGVSRRPNWPAVLFVGLIVHNALSRTLGLPLVYRLWYTRLLVVLWIMFWVWVIFGLIGMADRRAKAYLSTHNLSSTQSVLQLGRRLLQALVLVAAVLALLNSLGYDITAALAGLGIGGIAIAFAAQKTLENVFGGLSMLSDQSIRVGDSCQFATTVATVEDIGLRATRFRTVQRSVMFIPNGQLATMTIENLGLRDRILFKHVIGVKYGMEAGGMQALLDELRVMLESDSRISAEGRRVQFLRFGAYSLDIEMFCYVMTSDYPLFLRIQEELLLRVMEIVKGHDSDFAFPSQTLYVEQGKLELSGELPSTVATPPGATAE